MLTIESTGTLGETAQEIRDKQLRALVDALLPLPGGEAPGSDAYDTSRRKLRDTMETLAPAERARFAQIAISAGVAPGLVEGALSDANLVSLPFYKDPTIVGGTVGGVVVLGLLIWGGVALVRRHRRSG